jgi:hypothetical protein
MSLKQKNSLFIDDTSKFELFLKTREIQQVSLALQNVTRLPKRQRELWLKENGAFLAEEFDIFINNSNMTFEGLSMDEETLNLSRDLVLSLKEALSTVQGMLHKQVELDS